MDTVSAPEVAEQDPIPAGDLSSTIGAADFKARCLQIMDRVRETGTEVTITKHGHPVARLVPVAEASTRPPLIGACKDTLIIVDGDDAVPSTSDEWVEWEARIDAGWDAAGEA